MSFYVTGGSLESNAPSYVEREADRALLKGLLEGDFCYVLTARQMGKSSLMVRTASRLRAAGIRVAALDLTAIGGQNITPEQWYHGLLDMLGQALDLEDELARSWQENAQLGPLHRFMKVLRQAVLASFDTAAGANGVTTRVRLVIFVDEIDFVRSLPFHADEFFAAIRECYNRRTLDPAYHGLTFCLLGVASPSDLIRDTRTTPFNIGRRIELNDFTLEEAAPLAAGLQTGNTPNRVRTRQAADLLARILHWTEGHPYLTQKLCRTIAEALHGKPHAAAEAERNAPAFVDRICAGLFFSHRSHEQDDNLIFVRERLLRGETDRAGLLEVYLKIWQGQRVMDDELDPLLTQLRLSGVVRVRDGRLRERNRIYSRVFNAGWVRANMPQAELRRQRDTYRRRMIWTIALASVITFSFGLLTVVAMKATSESNLNQAKAWRSSGRIGQRINALAAIGRARRWGMIFGARQELCDEALAALNLVDLRPLPDITKRAGATNLCELNESFSRYALGHRDGRIQVFERTHRNLMLELPGSGLPVDWLRFDAKDRFLAVGYGAADQAVPRCVVWDLGRRSKLIDLPTPVRRQAVDFSRDGSLFAVGFQRQHLQVFRLPEGDVLFETPEDPTRTDGQYPVACVRFDPEGRQVATSSQGGLDLSVWSIGEKIMRKYGHPDEVVDLDWAPDRGQLATACLNGEIYLFPAFPENRKERLYRPGLRMTNTPTLQFNRSGTVLAAACADRSLRLWQPHDGKEMLASFDLDEPKNPRFSADDLEFSVTTSGGRVRLFAIEGGRERRVFRGAPDVEPFRSVAFDASGRVLMAAGPGPALWFWDVTNAKTCLHTSLHGFVWGTALDYRDSALYASSTHGLFTLSLSQFRQGDGVRFRIGSPRCLGSRAGLGPLALATNGVGAAIFRGTEADHIHVFRLPDPKHQAIFPGTKLEDIAISPDARWLFASPSTQEGILVWGLSGTGARGPGRIERARFLSSGPGRDWIITRWHGEIQFRKAGSWSTALTLPASSNPGVNCPVAVGPTTARDEHLVAAATSRSAIELFRFRDGRFPRLKRLARFESPDNLPVNCLVFDLTGNRLAAGSAGQIVQVWDLAQIRAELDAHGLAAGFPEMHSNPSSPPLQLTAEAVEEEVDTLTLDNLAWVDDLSERIEAAEAKGRPELFMLLSKRGQANRLLMRGASAARDFKKALELRPNDTNVTRMLAEVEQEISWQQPAASQAQPRQPDPAPHDSTWNK